MVLSIFITIIIMIIKKDLEKAADGSDLNSCHHHHHQDYLDHDGNHDHDFDKKTWTEQLMETASPSLALATPSAGTALLSKKSGLLHDYGDQYVMECMCIRVCLGHKSDYSC